MLLRYCVGFLLTATCCLSQSTHNCHPYGYHINNDCRPGNSHGTYADFVALLNDASQREHEPQFLIHVLMEMFQYVNPCADDAEAAYYLFLAGSHPYQPSQEWIDKVNPTFAHQYHFSDGDETLLHSMIARLVRYTSAGCLRDIWEHYLPYARSNFPQLYPNIHHPPPPPTTTTTTTTTTVPTTTVPTTTVPTTTVPTTVPTTTVPTTTVPTTVPTTTVPTTTVPTTTVPTTVPTTTVPTTTVPTTTVPTTVPTTTVPTTVPTTSLHPTTTPVASTTSAARTTSTSSTTSQPADNTPLNCTVCENLGCLLDPRLTTCSKGQRFCFITVRDSAQMGRDVTRGCADDSQCPNGEVTSVPGCENIENGLTATDTVCHFCCIGQNCNKPPALFPYKD